MNFEQSIQHWVEIDNTIRRHNEELKMLRNERNELSSGIMKIATESNLLHKTIEISDGKLRFQTTNTKSPLTLKYIKKCLMEKIESESNVNVLMDYIKDNRETKQNRDIKRMYAKA